MENETEKPVQVLGPLHSDNQEIEIHNLKQGIYLVYLEVQVWPSTSTNLTSDRWWSDSNSDYGISVSWSFIWKQN